MIIGPSVASFLILLFFSVFLSFSLKLLRFVDGRRWIIRIRIPGIAAPDCRCLSSLFFLLLRVVFFSLTCACALYLVIYHSRLFLLLYSSRTWNYIFFFAPRKEIFSDLFIFRKLFSSFPPICLKFFLFERKKTLTSSSFFFLSPSFFTSMYGEIKKPVAIFLL